jgi:hypothetical protein
MPAHSGAAARKGSNDVAWSTTSRLRLRGLDALAPAERAAPAPGRLPLSLAALVIVGLSAGLWFAVIRLAVALV